MKNRFNLIVLIVMLFLAACGNTPAVTQTIQTSTPTETPTVTPLPTFTLGIPTLAPISTLPNRVTPTYPPYHSPTPTDTATPTSTPDYAALGIPSPTPTPTFDYDKLSSFYLTPFTPQPTPTSQSKLSPTPSVEELLSKVVVRKVKPQSRPIFKLSDYIQRAADLMNYFGDDKEGYLQYINSISPTAFNFSNDWFWKNDYDNDGQPEWLISIPLVYYEDGTIGCGNPYVSTNYCPRNFFLFEKEGNPYLPVAKFPTGYGGDFGQKIVRIEDLNKNHSLDIVFQSDVCGTACTTYMSIAEWDGSKWSASWISSEIAEITFTDLDGNGTIEISLKHSTGAMSKYNYPYPFREGLVDVYGWQNGRYELVNQIYPPTDSIFATIFDVEKALEYKNAELAFRRINPVMETLDPSCDRMKTYVGIQAMLAYAFQGNSNGMKSTLAKLEKYCDFPRNAYLPAAKILWLAYEKSHDPIGACQAMEHFLWQEYTRENGGLRKPFLLNGVLQTDLLVRVNKKAVLSSLPA